MKKQGLKLPPVDKYASKTPIMKNQMKEISTSQDLLPNNLSDGLTLTKKDVKKINDLYS